MLYRRFRYQKKYINKYILSCDIMYGPIIEILCEYSLSEDDPYKYLFYTKEKIFIYNNIDKFIDKIE